MSGLRLHATGVQTLCKLVESEMNSLPLGYKYGRDANNSPILRIITPNMLRMGRINTRVLSGPVKMPSGPGDLMRKVEEGYKLWFNVWNSTVVPKVMERRTWFSSSREIKKNDVVMFQKSESDLSSVWTVGLVSDVIVSKDGLIRRVIIRYQNASENDARTTDRAVRRVVRLLNIDDTSLTKDMAEVEKLVKSLDKKQCEDVIEVAEELSEHEQPEGY